MSWHCSLALVEDFSALGCLDGGQCAQLRLTSIAERSCFGARKKATSRRSRSGTTYTHSMAKRGVEKWMSSLPDSRASRSAARGNDAGKTTHGTCGPKPSEPFVKYDPDSALWRTCPPYDARSGRKPKRKPPTSGEWLATWPKAGIELHGVCYRLPNWERLISVIDSGLWPSITSNDTGNRNTKYNQGGSALSYAVRYWPTPTVTGNHNRTGSSEKSGDGLSTAVKTWPTPKATDGDKGAVSHFGKSPSLAKAVKMFPTPTSSMMTTGDMEQARFSGNSGKRPDYQEANKFPTPTARDMRTGSTPDSRRARRQANGEWHSPNLNDVAAPGGLLNPTWVEWIMGWPIGWTDLEPLATDRFRQWLEQHGSC